MITVTHCQGLVQFYSTCSSLIQHSSAQTPDLSSHLWLAAAENKSAMAMQDILTRHEKMLELAESFQLITFPLSASLFLSGTPPLLSSLLLCVGLCIFRWVQTAELAWSKGSTNVPLGHCTGIQLYNNRATEKKKSTKCWCTAAFSGENFLFLAQIAVTNLQQQVPVLQEMELPFPCEASSHKGFVRFQIMFYTRGRNSS